PAAPPPSKDGERITPVARRMAQKQGIDVTQISGSGPSGRVTKQDVESHLAQKQAPEQPPAAPAATPPPAAPPAGTPEDPRGEERIRMTRRRRTIARRLVEAQQTAAMLTTFNEIDMSAVMDLRKRRQEDF